MSEMKKNPVFAIILIPPLFWISCQDHNLSNSPSVPPKIAESFCASPGRHLGNHITGDQRTYEVDNGRITETSTYSIKPATYQIIDGRHEGMSVEYVLIPTVYDTITSLVEIAVEVCPPKEMGVFLSCDEETNIGSKKTSRRVVVEPLRIEKCEVPFLYKDGKTHIVVQPSKVVRTNLHTDYQLIE